MPVATSFILNEDGSLTVEYDGGAETVPLAVRPDGAHQVFDADSRTWRDPRLLQQVKDDKWEEIKTARDTAEYGGFVCNEKRYDSDSISQQRIIGSVSMAMLAAQGAQPFSIDWTLSDNTVATLDGAGMIAVGEALGTHVATQHATARTLRTQIELALERGEVAEIVWPITT